MGYLVFILITIALSGGFLALTAAEAKRGTRLFAQQRAQLDKEIERALFVLEHVDLAAYLRAESKHLIERAGHDIAHLFLRLVRDAERLLTRLVRHLRTRQMESAVPRETNRAFVKTLADFKGHLEANRPEIPSVHEVQ